MFATLIDSYTTSRTEFQMTNGYQPLDSVFYVKSGSFSCQMNDKSELAGPDCIAIFESTTPMQRHVIEPVDFLYIKYHKKATAPHAPLPGIYRDLSNRMRDDLQAIEALSTVRTPLGLEIRSHYLNDLFLQLVSYEPSATVKTQSLLDLSEQDLPLEYLREHIKDGVTVDEVARHCGMSVSALEYKFKRLTGTSLYRCFMDLRMERATSLLASTSYSITQIATLCGYDNLFYFCNAFKKHTGMTPSAYRKCNLI